MNGAKVFASHAELELAKGLDERHSLDVTNRATQLNNAHFGCFIAIGHGNLCHSGNLKTQKIVTSLISKAEKGGIQ